MEIGELKARHSDLVRHGRAMNAQLLAMEKEINRLDAEITRLEQQAPPDVPVEPQASE